ncbi:hypothetical protein ACP70R_043715 [Stipagrostis hirtigluma subsp. patula]
MAAPSIPDDVILDILLGLPAAAVLRFRAVCKRWRALVDDHRFASTHHQRRPSMPLLCHRRDDHQDSTRRFRVRLEAVDLAARASQPVLRFAAPARGDTTWRLAGPRASALPVAAQDGAFDVHGSCDGVLLVSYNSSLYLCNPARRRWAKAPVSGLHGIVGFYAHRPSGEFRLLRHGRNTGFFANGYWVMTLSSPQTSRMITGIPEQLLAVGIRPASESPPALVSGSLHWLPRDPESAGTELLVFDTVRETFRRMRPPPAVDADGQAQTLLELNGKLTMTVTRGGLTTAQLWVLQEYAREDSWVCTLQVPLPAVNIVGDRPAAVAVMSQEGDVLVQCPQCLLQCDAMGTVRKHHQLEHHRTVAVPHMFKESLVPHASVNTTQIRTGYGGIPLPPFFSDTNC